MRTLSATTQTEIAKAVTRPFLLIELGFSATLRFATGGETVTWNSETWIPTGGPADGAGTFDINTDASGRQEGSLYLPNFDNTLSALVLGEGAAGKTCKVWQLYGAGPYAVDDAVALFDGVMDESPDIGDDYVEIRVFNAGIREKFTPGVYAAKPTFNHLPPRGSKITFNGEELILEPRR